MTKLNQDDDNHRIRGIMRCSKRRSRPGVHRGGKTMAFRIFLSAFLCSSVTAFVSPKRRAVSFVWQQTVFCQEQPRLNHLSFPERHIQCWELKRPIGSTRLYDGYETESMTDQMNHATNNSPATASRSGDDSNKSAVEGVNGVTIGVNGHEQSAVSITSDAKHDESSSASSSSTSPATNSINLQDIPMPTENGGFTHTAASRAKIAAANKGKVPWNKGQGHSDEVRARIAAGVRARNRERFLKKLEDMGVTEEEYEAQKKEERRKKEAERRARRTAKGGFRPTEETKAKISKILKEKHARGEIKRSNPTKVRRGFTHSEETRAKISESLKKRWASDPEYRERIKAQATKANSREETRKRISETLKKKWQNPEFREKMMAKMSSRETRSGSRGEEYRRKISEAMKAKWKDQEFREKALKSMAERKVPPRRVNRTEKKTKTATKGSRPPNVSILQPRKVGDAPKKERAPNVSILQPRKVGDAPKKERAPNVSILQPRKVGDAPKKQRARKKVIRFAEKEEDVLAARQPKPKGTVVKKTATKKRATKKREAKKKEPDGSVNRLREERRDLFDLLYGDDIEEEDPAPMQSKSMRFDFGDEDLDSFDPYGLEDY